MKRFISLHPSRFIKSNLLILLCLVTCFVPAQSVAPQKAILERKVQWVSGEYKFTGVLSFNYSDYSYYKSLPKKQPYTKYASEFESHAYFLNIAKVLDADARALGLSRTQLGQYLIDFVQQAIPYKVDPKNNGYDYPKYPIETIVEAGGDCEDKAALLVALLNTFGFDAVFIQFKDHMGVGIHGEKRTGSYYPYNGKKYYYIESTAPDWEIGVIPPEYKTAALVKAAPEVKLYARAETKSSTVAKTSGGEKSRTQTPGNTPAPTKIPVPKPTTTAESTTANQKRSTVVIIIAR